jgi:hypothetical protein
VDQPTVKSNKTANFVGMFLASYMLLAASLTNYLLYDRYPLLRVDTALAYLILAVVAALISGLFAAFNIWFQKLLFALLIALIVDINTDGSIWPGAAAAIFLVLTVRAKEVPHQLFVIFGGFFLVSSLIGLGQNKTCQKYYASTDQQTGDNPCAARRAYRHRGLSQIGVW